MLWVKKKYEKKKILERKKVVKFMKMSAYISVPFPSPVVSKANNQIPSRRKQTLRAY